MAVVHHEVSRPPARRVADRASLTVDWATEWDLRALEVFMERHYGPAAVQNVPGRFRWLFARHPEGLHVSVCRAGGEIVAACGHLPVTLILCGRRVEAAYGIDFMVAPEWRRMGIGRRMLALRLKRFPVSLSTGQSQSMGGLYQKTPARVLDDFFHAYFIARLPLRGSARELARGALARALAARAPSVEGTRRPIPLREAAAAVWTCGPRLGPDEAGPEPTTDRILWRHGGPVYDDSQAFELITSSGERGILISRFTTDGTEHLLDLLAPHQARSRLLRLAGQTTPSGQLEASACGRRMAAELRKMGFLVRPREAHLVALARSEEIARRLDEIEVVWFAGESDVDLMRHPR